MDRCTIDEFNFDSLKEALKDSLIERDTYLNELNTTLQKKQYYES